jgi:sensor histidine kinase YesM
MTCSPSRISKKNAEDALTSAQELAEAANRSKAELELRALQMQMNPHFIFNALNSIQSYIINKDEQMANSDDNNKKL